jgi:metallo-beta-lactamase family protein
MPSSSTSTAPARASRRLSRYTERDAIATLGQFLAIGYERPFSVAPGVTVTFYDAGHMLGSAIVALDVEDGDAGRHTRLVFTGDLGRPNTTILRDPTVLAEANALIMECTYGGRIHDSYPDATKALERIVNETYQRGGKVIIPAFAVGRTQQIVYALNQLYHDGQHRLPDMRVFVDSPLAVDATGIFRLHPDSYREETRKALLEDPDGDIFGFHRLTYVRQVEDSKEINSLHEPCIIISASGMAEAGRILHHLKNNIENPNNTILIVGWQAPNTLGRRLVEKQPTVHIFGEEYKLRAHVEVINGFSGHADHNELMAWASGFKRKPKHTFLVHGEDESLQAVQKALRGDLGFENVAIADLGQTVEI